MSASVTRTSSRVTPDPDRLRDLSSDSRTANSACSVANSASYFLRPLLLRHRGRISGGRQELTAAAVSRSYTHSAQITKTFNAMISRDHIG